jgi:UDP-N-acetyl-D-glucosamine dehydrogenase
MRVAVVGQGYVGLPLAIEACRAGHDVLAVESDPYRLSSLRGASSYIPDVPSPALRECVGSGRFTPMADLAGAPPAEVYVLAVPTSSTASNEPALEFLDRAVRSVAAAAPQGALVVIESTVHVGATRRHVLPLLEATSRRRVGSEIHLAYSPERIDPGRRTVSFSEVQKLVSGVDTESGTLARKFYETMFDNVQLVSSCEVAEFAKLFENTFRYLNIALVNELALAAHNASIDFREVVAAASSKPYGFMPFHHGPGVGGHCLPNNVRYLQHSISQFREPSKILDAAMEVNESAPGNVVDRARDALDRHGRSLRGATVLVVGIAYKPNVPDVRAAPALEIIRRLQAHGARVRVADPLAADEIRRLGMEPVVPTRQECRAADLVVIVTDHDNVDYRMIAREARLVLDCRGRINQPAVEQF